MDCLFTDKEAKEMLIYANELRNRNLEPIMYVAPDWDIVNSSWTVQYTSTASTTHMNEGIVGMYYGIPVYAFEGLDSHTCCVLPRFLPLPF